MEMANRLIDANLGRDSHLSDRSDEQNDHLESSTSLQSDLNLRCIPIPYT